MNLHKAGHLWDQYPDVIRAKETLAAKVPMFTVLLKREAGLTGRTLVKEIRGSRSGCPDFRLLARGAQPELNLVAILGEVLLKRPFEMLPVWSALQEKSNVSQMLFQPLYAEAV